MVEDGLVLSMVMIMSEQEDFGRLCATVRETERAPRINRMSTVFSRDGFH